MCTAGSRFRGKPWPGVPLGAGLLGLVLAWAFGFGSPVCRAQEMPHPLVPFRADPDQVLVLYNADWTRDVEGSDPGQDSREVAEYYVRMHTDPETGKCPRVLGLRCVHGKQHLNHWVIEEKSQDNKDGIVFKGKGPGPKAGEWARDSRAVELVIEPGETGIEWETVDIQCRSSHGGEWLPVSPQVTGAPRKKGRRIVYPEVEPGRGRCYLFDAHAHVPGTVEVRVQAKDPTGRKVRERLFNCYDRDDFRFSETGPDGIADDLHFQEDVALPVKRFLEDPKNALPDGTPLKEHVLYMVVCHGLPYACEGVFGIERGVTSSPRDHGDLASLENRLQTLYYGWGFPIRPPVISMYMSGGPEAREGLRNHRITTAMRHPLIGRSWNPYMHPDTYGFRTSQEPPRIFRPAQFPEVRKQRPSPYFAYGVSRIDGEGPEDAKRQVDYAVYASRHLRPEMDCRVRQGDLSGAGTEDLSGRMDKVDEQGLWGPEALEALGFPVSRGHALPFMARPPEDEPGSESAGEKAAYGYYPGGMDLTIASNNGWNMGRHVGIWRQVAKGVSVSACGGPASGGGPHITSATFWDPRILMHFLFRGRDLGECFLFSTCYVNWSTSLLGDPLYHPDLRRTVPDTIPPRVASRDDVAIRLVPTMDGFAGTLRTKVRSTPGNPEVARLRVTYAAKGDARERKSRSPLYSSRPRVVLRDLDPEAQYTLHLVLRDPYGNETNLNETWGPWELTTPGLSDRTRIIEQAEEREKGWRIAVTRRKRFNESGRVCVAFQAGENGMLPSLRSDGLAFLTRTWNRDRVRGTLLLGDYKREFYFTSPLKPGQTARMEIRWRRFPLTREVLLTTDDGQELSVASDVHTPWQPFSFSSPLWITGSKGTRVSSAFAESDAGPASEAAR